METLADLSAIWHGKPRSQTALRVMMMNLMMSLMDMEKQLEVFIQQQGGYAKSSLVSMENTKEDNSILQHTESNRSLYTTLSSYDLDRKEELLGLSVKWCNHRCTDHTT